jgi:hypothetical protein
MRSVLGLVILLLLTGPVGAEEAAPKTAPTEKAALSATRNFLRALNQVTEEDRSDLVARYVDTAAFTSRVFGDALKGLPATQLAQVDDALHQLFSKSVFGGFRDVPDLDRVSFESAELPGTLRSVTCTLKSEKVSFVWARGSKSSRLVDLGSPKRGFMSVSLARRWKKGGQAPAAFMGSLMGKPSARSLRARQLTLSKDNIKTLITLMLARRIGRVGSGWPAYSGKAFVLYVVATGDLDRRRAENLEILFSPADKAHSLARVGTVRYEDVTKVALKKGTFDLSGLTSYAGRRNAERGMQITSDLLKEGTPIIADLSFDDVAVVGFSSGDVRVLTRKELGLGPKDPIVVGDKAKSEILRVLSDK